MALTAANLGGVADGRLSVEPDAIGSKEYEGHHGQAVPVHGHGPTSTKLFDPNVTFAEYNYYAEREREYERGISPKKNVVTGLATVVIGKTFSKKEREEQLAIRTGSVSGQAEPTAALDEKTTGTSPSPFAGVVSDEEWHTASRAARTATWGAVFYLITTDVLGPFSVPWAFTQLGYGPGVALYTVFAALAGFSGYLLWQQFLGLDSSRYPVTGYGDIAFRIYGSWARHVANILQSFQFYMGVVLLIITNAQGLVQLAAGPSGTGCLCFVVAEVIFLVLGCLLGQIRTLQRFSHLANIAIWLNVFVIIMTMIVASTTGVNWEADIASGYVDQIEPIYTVGGIPPGKGLTDNINGLMQAVYSYGGATLFMNLLAEMRRPWDFWKALIIADVFIFLCYLIFGVVVYSYQGQATFNPAYQGLNPYAWQTVGNVFGLVTGLIAAVLYGNIGMKVLYANVGREFFRFPVLESRAGKWIWVAFVPGYWVLAFILAAAVPQVSYLSAFVGAAFILQFSYTFPPALMIGYNCLKDSLPADGGFDPTTGAALRDNSFARIWRGYKVRFFSNTWNTIYFLGSAVTAILGIYASIVGMIDQFNGSAITPFSCISPVSTCFT